MYRFHQVPHGCFSDKLSETICYDTVTKQLQVCAESKAYQLVEHLAWSLADTLLKTASMPVDISVSVHKKAPIEQVGHCMVEVKRTWPMILS